MPTTPGGRWSPNNGDGYDLITHLAAMQVSNESATANAIANAPKPPSNYRIGTSAERLAIPSADRYKGLTFYETDTNREWFYDGSTWLPNDNGVFLIRPTSVSGGTIAANGIVTFSGGNSVSLNGIFPSRFTQFEVRYSTSGKSANDGVRLRFRSGGSDHTGASSYAYRRNGTNGAGYVEFTGVSSQIEPDFNAHSDVRKSFLVEAAAGAEPTRIVSGAGSESNNSSIGQMLALTGEFRQNVAVDGITLFCQPTNGGNIGSGTVSVYGRI